MLMSVYLLIKPFSDFRDVITAAILDEVTSSAVTPMNWATAKTIGRTPNMQYCKHDTYIL